MSKANAERDRSKMTRRVRSDREMLERLASHLQRLEDQCALFDAGRYAGSIHMATELQNVLVENDVAVKARAKQLFVGADFDDGEVCQLFHVAVHVGADTAAFAPHFWASEIVAARPFTEWWNRQIIWRAPASSSPADRSPEPSVGHRTLNRRQLVEYVRHGIAAHGGRQLESVLDRLDHGLEAAHLHLEFSSGVRQFGRPAGSVVTAMLRQIAHEVLVTYGHDDPRPAR